MKPQLHPDRPETDHSYFPGTQIGQSPVHDFNESLTRSKRYANASWWWNVYQDAFPNLANMVYIDDDGWAQRGGVDRVLTLTSGKTVYIDEKVREGVWNDILLEVWSSVEHNRPGWIQKDLACDFIAYIYAPTQTGHMLPALPLRKAWLERGNQWIDWAQKEEHGFKIVEAPNVGYTSLSIAVPTKILLDAIQRAGCVSWPNTQRTGRV